MRYSKLQSRKNNQSNEAGFTIVEFMIATAVFSMVLLICAFAIVHVGRMYYKGVITNRTQDASRRVIEDIAAAIQFGPRSTDPSIFVRPGPSVTADDITWQVLCIGDNKYTYSTDTSMGSGDGQSPHVLWKDRIDGSGCTVSDFDPDDGQELLGSNMRLPLFVVTPPSSGLLWNIQIRVTYGDSADLFDGEGSETNPNDRYRFCKGVIAGGQFCAVSGFDTSVIKRL